MAHVDQKEHIHRHSGWLVPAIFLCAILLLSGLFMGWYLRPGPRSPASPSDQPSLVELMVDDQAFHIPANYIQNSAARLGGKQQSIALAALFPSWQGYSDANARLFAANAPDSAVVRLSLRGDANPLDAPARLARIYLPDIADPKGITTPYGLTRYEFVDTSGYAREDLFAGETDGGLMLFLCEQQLPQLPSPNCLATDQPIGKSVSLSWRFKRAWLAQWRELSGGAKSLIAHFQARHAK